MNLTPSTALCGSWYFSFGQALDVISSWLYYPYVSSLPPFSFRFTLRSITRV